MWTIVDPEGTAHDIADEAALLTFAHAQGLRSNNLRHHLGLFAGNGESVHVKEYILLEKLQWLRRKGCSEFVPVVGGVDRFMRATVTARSGIDMPFQMKKLREHLSHARKNGPALNGCLSKFQWQVVAAPVDPGAWLARAGTVPTEPENPVAAPSTAAPPAPAADSPAEQQAIDAAFDASQLTLRVDAARRAAAKAHDAEQLRLGLALSESQTRPERIIDAAEEFLVEQVCRQSEATARAEAESVAEASAAAASAAAASAAAGTATAGRAAAATEAAGRAAAAGAEAGPAVAARVGVAEAEAIVFDQDRRIFPALGPGARGAPTTAPTPSGPTRSTP